MVKGFFLANGAFLWNNEKQVGPHCPNVLDEVQLVQLGYFCMAANPRAQLSQEERAALAQVVPGAFYDGSPDDPLSVAIRTHEKNRGGTQDGIVSPMHASSGKYDAGHTWILVALNNNIADILGKDWPHLERHDRCPKALADASIRVFTR